MHYMTQTQESTPGIGTVGQVELSNNGTRLVKVFPNIMSHHQLIDAALGLANGMHDVQRRVIKAVTTEPFPPNTLLHNGPFTVEASLPFEAHGQSLNWVVCGHNSGSRAIDEPTKHQRFLDVDAFRNGRFFPQTAAQLWQAFRSANPSLGDVSIIQISPDNFADLKPTITNLYQAAFTSYPYDVVNTIETSCGRSVFVCTLDSTNRAVAITGAELMTLPCGVAIGEIGDSASLPDVKSSGALMKRALLSRLEQLDRIPHLAFTDSRIAPVLAVNQRAGLLLSDHTLLPRHTQISSTLAPGITVDVTAPNGAIFQVEDMTMTYADHTRIRQVLDTYGRVNVN